MHTAPEPGRASNTTGGAGGGGWGLEGSEDPRSHPGTAAGTKWPTAPAGNLQGLGGLYLFQKPGLLLEGLPSVPRQLTGTGRSNPGPRSGGRHSWSLAPDD